jgi:hypothetical protein
MGHNLKIVEPSSHGPREELRLAIAAVEQAEAVDAKSRSAMAKALDHLRATEAAHAHAKATLEDARSVQRPLADRLAEAGSDDERFALVEEHNASIGRPAVTAEDLRKARILLLDAEDGVTAARSTLEQLRGPAVQATAMANRSRDRRKRAIYAVLGPEVPRLLQAAEQLAKELGEARLSLRYISGNLVDSYGDERREIDRFLNRDIGQLFPEENGFKAEPSKSLAAWTAFSETIARDPDAPFP